MTSRTPDILTISTGIIHTPGITDTPIGDALYRMYGVRHVRHRQCTKAA